MPRGTAGDAEGLSKSQRKRSLKIISYSFIKSTDCFDHAFSQKRIAALKCGESYKCRTPAVMQGEGFEFNNYEREQ